MGPAFSLSAADSARFDLRVIRGRIDAGQNAEILLRAIRDLEADVAIVRCPAGDIVFPQQLRASGFDPIHADTLVYYSRTLDRESFRTQKHTTAYQVELASPAEKSRIASIAAESFADYRSHYSVNPLFDRKKVLSGYVEWAQSFLLSEDANKETWVVRESGETQGFATCLIDRELASIEIVLNAVSPPFMGRGLYGSLLRAIVEQYAARGLNRIVISTQVWNYVVQRAWVRAGFLLDSAFDTYHINVFGRHGSRDVA